jgi:hypothetical protein
MGRQACERVVVAGQKRGGGTRAGRDGGRRGSPSTATLPPCLPLKMPIQHVVAFQYKPGTPAASVDEVARAFLALKDDCKLPTGDAYISRLQGGRQDSPEGQHRAMEHVYLVEFEVSPGPEPCLRFQQTEPSTPSNQNDDDRRFYLDKDPVHETFKARHRDRDRPRRNGADGLPLLSTGSRRTFD